MKFFELMALITFLIACSAGAENIGVAFILVLVSFFCGWLSIPKRKRGKR